MPELELVRLCGIDDWIETSKAFDNVRSDAVNEFSSFNNSESQQNYGIVSGRKFAR